MFNFRRSQRSMDPAKPPEYTRVTATARDTEEDSSDQSPRFAYHEAAESTIRGTDDASVNARNSYWKRLVDFWSDSWTAELLSCVIVVISLACLIAVLRVYEGRVLQDLPIGISLNTLISIVASIFKAALIMPVAEAISQLKWIWYARKPRPLTDFEHMDRASRGPWGSFLLLFNINSSHFVTLGAWITIAAFAVDPFTQQIINYYPCQQLIPQQPARVMVANNLTRIGESVGRIQQDDRRWYTANGGLSAAAYSGLLGEAPDASRYYHCPTGNCTFPSDPKTGASYQTLAFDSTCNDLTSMVKFNENIGWHLPHMEDVNLALPDETWNADIRWHRGAVDSAVTGPYFDYPNQGNLSRNASLDWDANIRTMLRAISPWETLGFDSPAGYASKARMQGFPLFAFTALMINIDWANESMIVAPDGSYAKKAYGIAPFAVECQLYPVVKTLRATVKGNNLTEAVLSSTILTNRDTKNASTTFSFQHLSDTALRNGTWAPCTPSPTYTPETPVLFINARLGNDFRIDDNLNGTATLSGPGLAPVLAASRAKISQHADVKYYAQDCVWTIEGQHGYSRAEETLRYALADLFDGQILDSRPKDEYNVRGKPWLNRLYANGTTTLPSVTAYVADLASSLSAYIRTWGHGGVPVVIDGQSYTTETCIGVQWLWGILPASLVPITLVFLVVTMWRSPRSGAPERPWKSSSLAVLFHGLDGDVRDRYGDLVRASRMEDVAGGLRVRLVGTGEGWRLKQ